MNVHEMDPRLVGRILKLECDPGLNIRAVCLANQEVPPYTISIDRDGDPEEASIRWTDHTLPIIDLSTAIAEVNEEYIEIGKLLTHPEAQVCFLELHAHVVESLTNEEIFGFLVHHADLIHGFLALVSSGEDLASARFILEDVESSTLN